MCLINGIAWSRDSTYMWICVHTVKCCLERLGDTNLIVIFSILSVCQLKLVRPL